MSHRLSQFILLLGFILADPLDLATVVYYGNYLQGLASSSRVILMKGRTGFSTKEPNPSLNLLVRLAIFFERVEPKSLIIFRSSNIDADRSIR